MATPQPVIQMSLDDSATRLVWVLNRDEKPYKATFEGIQISIPPMYQKIAKRYTEGGNLMPHTAARQFITDYKQPQEWVMDGGGKPQPVFGVKALFEQELTLEEFQDIVGKSSTQVKKEAAADEKRARKILKEELDRRPNKIAVDNEDE